MKELHVIFRTFSAKEKEYQLYGEGFKQSILNGKAFYDKGDISRFVKIEMTTYGSKLHPN